MESDGPEKSDGAENLQTGKGKFAPRDIPYIAGHNKIGGCSHSEFNPVHA